MTNLDTNSEKNVSTTGDAGVELSYNKRNRVRTGLSWKDLQNLDPTLKVSEAKKLKIYPKPDYEELVKSGMHPLLAHIVKQAYDAIATEPATRSTPSDEDIENYIESIHQYMDGVLSWAGNKTLSSQWMLAISRRAGSNLSALSGQLTALSDLSPQNTQTLLQVVYGENWKAHLSSIRIIGSNKILSALQPSLDDAVRAMKDINKGWPGKLESWQKQGYRIVNGATIEIETREGSNKIKPDEVERYVTAWVLLTEGTRQYHIEVEKFNVDSKNDPIVIAYSEEKIRGLSRKHLLLNKSNKLINAFDSIEEAKIHARDITKRTKLSSSIDEKGISVETARRVGPEHRQNNRDISSEELIETFGFKGINFGNWMKGKNNDIERQLHLNHIFDSFMDMSYILEISPRAISLGGMLGIAVGAQGNGQNAAHFVPGLNELNITRTSGAGLTSHEWGHAFDHYMARIAGLERHSAPYFSEHSEIIQSGIRSEVANAFKNIVNAMNNRPMTSEEMSIKKSKEVEKANKYIASWLKGIRQEFDSHVLPNDSENHPLNSLFQKVTMGEYGDFVAGKYYPVIEDIRQLYKSLTKKSMPTNLANGLQTNLNHMQRISAPRNEEANSTVKLTHTFYAENASKLDLDKGGKPYWNTNTEKFARAFDVYISDAMAAKGFVNTYLSLAGRQDETTPNGDERIEINSRIRHLIELVSSLELKNEDKASTVAATEEIENRSHSKSLFKH